MRVVRRGVYGREWGETGNDDSSDGPQNKGLKRGGKVALSGEKTSWASSREEESKGGKAWSKKHAGYTS